MVSLRRGTMVVLLLAAGCGEEGGSMVGQPDASTDCMLQPGGCGCKADAECGGATPRCDRNSGRCVACLPQSDNCQDGRRCVASNDTFICATGCLTESECGNTDAGTAIACCTGACLDVQSDSTNCGACGRKCPTPEHAVASCAGGACGLGPCAAGWTDCDGSSANGCEVHSEVDVKNCGGCNRECTAGANTSATCAGGRCQTACNAGFADCDADTRNGCEVRPESDVAHCGGCGMACPMLAQATSVCRAGACAIGVCTAGFADCNQQSKDGCEAELVRDPDHCGACGTSCQQLANATGLCRGGACAIGACNPGFADCDGLGLNGCERQIGNDPQNCGGCGRACIGAHSMQDCNGGVCAVRACDADWGDCDGMVNTGCEIPISLDMVNCGRCGNVCPMIKNGTIACNAGQCGIGQCSFGYADCNKDPADGCEAGLLRVETCGACQIACQPPAHATAGCNAGVCGVGQCEALWGDCDKMGGNGCELSLAADKGNCGACGNACVTANGMPACVNGVCGTASCNAGFDDCDKDPKTGCEIDVRADTKNCGACGNVCPMNAPYCVNSACIDAVFPSSLLVNGPQGEQINAWIGSPGQAWKLCYRRTRDGANSQVFHNLCNNKGASVTVASLNTGRLMGGYMPASWANSNNYIGNGNAFLFSLTNNYKHVAGAGVGGNQYWGYDEFGYGPTFGGGHDWHIPGNMTSGGYCNIGYSYGCRVGSYQSSTCRNDLCGSYSGWQVVELEVWVK